jgi:hypothetical protein
VRRVRDQIALRVEQCAGEIESLLDVDRGRGVRERYAHLLGNGHEEIVEHFEQYRVDACADGACSLQRLHATQDEVIERRDLGSPAGVDHDRGVALADDGGTGNGVPGLQRVAIDERGVVPLPVEEHRPCCWSWYWGCRSGFSPTLRSCRAKARPTAL